MASTIIVFPAPPGPYNMTAFRLCSGFKEALSCKNNQRPMDNKRKGFRHRALRAYACASLRLSVGRRGAHVWHLVALGPGSKNFWCVHVCVPRAEKSQFKSKAHRLRSRHAAASK